MNIYKVRKRLKKQLNAAKKKAKIIKAQLKQLDDLNLQEGQQVGVIIERLRLTQS